MNKTFEENILNKVKESIGDFISDDDLKKLVEKGIQEAFFKERIISTGYYGNENKILPSPFVELIQNLLKDKIFEILKEYVNSHSEEVNKAIRETLEQGIYELMMNYFRNQSAMPLQELISKLQLKNLI